MERIFRWVLFSLLSIVVIMECVQVILRYFLHMPILWLDETIIFPAIWIYMLGCANASRENTQITAKILPVFFSKPHQTAFIDVCAQIFSTIVAAWLTWYAVDYFIYAMEVNRQTGYLFISFTIGESALCIGMLLTTAYTIRQLIVSCRHLSGICHAGGQRCC